MSSYEVYLQRGIQGKHQCNNYVETTKYSFFSFVPKSIFFQFLRLANFYFLCTAILQCIPGLSPINPLTAIGPLVLVLLVAMIKEALEDLVFPNQTRRKNDKIVNHSKCLKWAGEWTPCEWQHLLPGDLIKVLDTEQFPADLVLLTSSERNGECKVQTSNLDGETSLKTKQALELTQALFDSDSLRDPKLLLRVVVNPPCYGLSAFSGSIFVETQHFIDSKQLLLRGSNLKNTAFVIGMVVYAGHQTKIMLNQKTTPFKRSRFENILNKIVIFQLIIQTGLCLFLAISSVSFENDKDSRIYTFNLHPNPWTQGTTAYFSFFLLLNSLIPISLIVNLELVKFLLSYFMQTDLKMYCKVQDKTANVQSMSILEELGAIDYIFCDKTGTLTANIMNYKGCNIAGVTYFDTIYMNAEEDEDNSKNIFTERKEKCGTLQDIINELSARDETSLSFNFSVSGQNFRTQSDFITEFWLCILLCNDIVIDKSQPTLTYLSSSPDEVALIEAARHYDFEFLDRSASGIFTRIRGVEKFFEVLATNDFTSERKCMSVVVKDPETGLVKLYIKGADEALMRKMDYSMEYPYMEKMNESLKSFAELGLRTLHVGFKLVEEVDDWLIRFEHVKCFHCEDQKNKLDELACEIEENIVAIGITAVEDQLQKSVSKAIKEFSQAGIHVWMITGDKLETAENIAYSCSLLERGWITYYIRGGEDVPAQIAKIKQEIATNDFKKKKMKIGLIIEGDALSVAIEKDKSNFFKICKVSNGVVCCRANPKQKAKIVNFIRKKNPQAKTLAIGDGGNDISMIQMAHVGVGIYGKEGHQAANSSDFAIAEFRFLRHLIFVHGRWNSKRIGYFILYFFFKNLAFTLVQGYFAFNSGFSGQTVWDDWYLLLFNSAITAAGVTCFALWEQDLNYRLDRNVKVFWPELYKANRTNLPMTLGKYFLFMLWGMFCSATVFIVCSQGFMSILRDSGNTETFWDYSVCMYSSIVIIVQIVLIIEMKYWSWIQFFTIWVLGFALYCPMFMFIYNEVPGTYVYKNTYDFLSLPVFWACLWLAVGICTVPYYAFHLYLQLFHPTPANLFLQGRYKLPQPQGRASVKTDEFGGLYSTSYSRKGIISENRS